MSNLIITIISIGLFAVAAIMGAYYGGQAFQQGQISSLATAMVNEATQINIAQRMWATNKNQPDITGTYISGLVTAKDLEVFPGTVIQQLGGTPNNVYWGEQTTLNYAGYASGLTRSTFTYNNGNYVFYIFTRTTSSWGAGDANHPAVQIAAAIDSKLGIPPSYTTLNGVAHMSGGSALSGTAPNTWFAWGTSNSIIDLDASGNLITNLCYYYNQYIVCVFGPS